MGLDVALVDVGTVEFALDHDVGCRHGGVGVASLEGVWGDVRWIRRADELLVVLLVGEWRAVGHGLVDAEHDRQELVLDLDRGGCGLRLRLGRGGDGSDRRPWYSTVPRANTLIDTSWFGSVMSSAGKSSPVTTAFTPGIASAIDVSIDTMLAWACGDRRYAVQLARQVEVGCEASLAHDLVVAVVTDRAGADPLVGLGILDGGHVALLSCTAASWTERMILS